MKSRERERKRKKLSEIKWKMRIFFSTDRHKSHGKFDSCKYNMFFEEREE